jgi:hypothetical protein
LQLENRRRPTFMSIITRADDNAPAASKSRWLACFYLCIPVGYALGYVLGGLLGGSFGCVCKYTIQKFCP